jgi:hypothetical protein
MEGLKRLYARTRMTADTAVFAEVEITLNSPVKTYRYMSRFMLMTITERIEFISAVSEKSKAVDSKNETVRK